MTEPVVFAITSDHHSGSTVGLCPPEKVGLDDGGFYEPSEVQQWIWSNYVAFWREVREIRDALKAKLYAVLNGDLFEGDHHGTAQIISRSTEPQEYIAGRIFGGDVSGRGSPVTDALPDRVFVVRGTEAHVGPSGVTEERFARTIKAERNPETHKWSWWRLRMTVHGVRLDFQHHPGTAGRFPWTAPQAVQRLAFLIWSEHELHSIPAPHLAFRSHVHKGRDSYDAYPTRAIVTPAWQVKTGYAHKVVPESLSDVGGVIAIIYPDGRVDVRMKKYPIPLPEEWYADADAGVVLAGVEEEPGTRTESEESEAPTRSESTSSSARHDAALPSIPEGAGDDSSLRPER